MILDDVQSNVEMRRMWDLLESEAPESAFLLSREYPEIRRPDMGYGIFVLDDENSILSRAVELMGKLDLDASHFERSDDTSRFDKALAVLDQREFATTFPDAFVDDCKAVTQNTLYALAKSFVSGDGDIVDFSAFLGASTFALSEGLAANDDVAVKQARIHAFDGFEFTSPPAEKYIQGRVPLSGSTLALFYENVAERAELINACPKSLSTVRWCGRPIELLSGGKTPSPYINAHLMAEFVPSMMTGKSVLVSPEILSAHRHFPAYIFAYLSDHFDIIDVRNNDVIAGYRKLIPQEKINRIIENRFTPDERLDLVLDLAEKVSDRHFAPTFLIQAGRLALSSHTLLNQVNWLDLLIIVKNHLRKSYSLMQLD